ncbi:9026_t:CDS:2, partial [Paraglomus occultum]
MSRLHINAQNQTANRTRRTRARAKGGLWRLRMTDAFLCQNGSVLGIQQQAKSASHSKHPIWRSIHCQSNRDHDSPSAAWNESPTAFVQTVPNFRGVIAGLGIDIHFRILERIFITGPVGEDYEADDVGLFLARGFRVLDKGEKSWQTSTLLSSCQPYATGLVPILLLEMSSELIKNNGPNATAHGDINEEEETIFYMFPAHVLTQLYAFVRAGIHQSILSNRRTVKIQHLLHRIGRYIIDFADPRFWLCWKPCVNSKKLRLEIKYRQRIFAPPNTNDGNQQGARLLLTIGSKATKTIKLFKKGATPRLRKMIQNHYKQWKKDTNYFLGGALDPSNKALRRSAKKA